MLAQNAAMYQADPLKYESEEAIRNYSPDEIDTAIRELGKEEEPVPDRGGSIELLDMANQPGSMALNIEGQTSDFGSQMANMGGI